MRQLLNFLGRSLRTVGGLALAGAGSTIDTVIRYVWTLILSFTLGVIAAVLTQSSWWFPILGIITILFVLYISVTVKGFWTIGFLVGLDATRKVVPKSIKSLYPELDYPGFRLLRFYVRAILATAILVGVTSLVFGALPIWRAPKLVGFLLLAMIVLVLSTAMENLEKKEVAK